MILRTAARRVFALDLRPRSFGFVVFEEPEELLDWGVKIFRDLSGNEVPAGKRLAPVLREFDPSLVLLKSTIWERKKTNVQLASILDAVRLEGKDRIAVRLISPQRIRRMFADDVRKGRSGIAGCRTFS